MAKVTLEKVSKLYPGGVLAVKDVSLEIEDKEFVVLVGPSGCGKSTLLRMVAGLEEITEGRILIDDRVVNDVAPKDRDIAMVFQNYALYPHMSVYDNMAFGLRMRKLPKDKINERVQEAASILGIESLLDRKPKALSGGQRQRVAVGRAMVRQPKVFLFDEPLSNLDAKLRVQMRAELSALHSRLEATMIYVTHDQTEAMTMGDKIAVLKDGLIHQVDGPLAIYDQPADVFVAGFIGSPAMNILSGTIRKENTWVFECPAFEADLPERLTDRMSLAEGMPVLLGIRPEHMGISQDAEKLTIGIIPEVVEPMGHETHLRFLLGDSKFTARLKGDTQCRVGGEVRLSFDLERCLLFDERDGKALRR